MGLGISHANVHAGMVEQDDMYEFCHKEESGGISLNEGKKRKRNEENVDGEAGSSDEDEYEDDEDEDEDEELLDKEELRSMEQSHFPSLVQ